MYQSIMLAQIERELASPAAATRRKPASSKSSKQQARVLQAEPFSNAFAPLTVAFLNARRCTLETGAIDVDATANAVQQAMPRASVAVLLEVCRSAQDISRSAPDRPAGLTATEKEGGEDQVARLAAATGMYAAFCPVEYETRIRWGRGTVGRVGSRTDQLCTGHVVLTAWPPLAVRRVNLPWRSHTSDDWGGPTHQAGIAVAVQPPGWSRAVWVVAGAASPDASGHAQWLQAAAMLGWMSQLPPFVPKASEQLALAGSASGQPASQSKDTGLHRNATAASCGYVLDPAGERIVTDTDTQSLGSVLCSSLFSLLGAVLCGVGSITRSAACCYRCGTAGGGCCPRPYSPLLDDDAEPHASAGVCAPGRQAKEVGLVADNVVLCWDSATPGSAAPARLLGSAGLARASGVAPKLRGCTTLLMCRSRAAGVDGGGFWSSFGVWRRLSCRWVTDTASGLRSYQAAHQSLPAPGQPPEWDRTVVCHSCWRCRAVHQPSPVDSEGMYVAAGGALGVADYTLRAPADVKRLGPVAARAADMPGMPPLLHPLHVLTLIPRAQVTEMTAALKCA